MKATTTYRTYSILCRHEAVEFIYNGKRRAGRVEAKVAGPSGAVLTLAEFEGGFRSFSVDKIVGLTTIEG